MASPSVNAPSAQSSPRVPVEAQQPSPASRLPSLTGLRFVAALVVFVYHTSRTSPTLVLAADKGFAHDFHEIAQPAGGLGVSFFFVLSGFILTWSARSTDTAAAFWRRRAVKIFPNYVLGWAAAMLLFAAATTPDRTAILNLLTLQSWTPGFRTYFSVDPPAWSIGVEVLFYALFPLLLPLVRRIGPQHLKYWIGGALLGIFAVPMTAYLALPSTPQIVTGPVSDDQFFFAYIFPPARLFDFLLGVLVARAVQAGRWRNAGMAWSALLLAAGYALSFQVPFLYGQRFVCIIPIAMLIAAAATADVQGRASLFRSRAMVWLGNISFAFYLLHFVVLVTVRKALGHELYPTPTTLAILAADLVISIAVSGLVYTLVERPVVRRWSSPRRTAA
ncbi:MULTISPECIES: acyltransferase [unclassified Kitasatospora]|uniref:acyltransferase family protein n=1 Tax=unclassified Kitasatospora TaxID=2633591 RepID=UPI00070CE8D5|nr:MULTISPECIES: acyltransferase [unclassified Kitasatospora]KQV13230.1 acyltransferase [Kitasatospora sp. Root107]KRB75321.1 acyltransferase [Kitasatospora sp. Root187]